VDLDENAISEAGVEQLHGMLGATLGPLDDNDPDMAQGDEEDEGEDHEGEEEEDDELSAALAATHL
jgi:hypothetical protein